MDLKWSEKTTGLALIISDRNEQRNIAISMKSNSVMSVPMAEKIAIIIAKKISLRLKGKIDILGLSWCN